MVKAKNEKLIVIGASFGGIKALRFLLPNLRTATQYPIAIVQHIKPHGSGSLANTMAQVCHLDVVEAYEYQFIEPNKTYIAPADYHLFVEKDKTFSLSKDDPVSYSRPSIDVLFESAADVYESAVISILLTGANNDGAAGTKYVKNQSGLTIAQDPKDTYCECDYMPKSAIALGCVDKILKLQAIPDFIKQVEVK